MLIKLAAGIASASLLLCGSLAHAQPGAAPNASVKADEHQDREQGQHDVAVMRADLTLIRRYDAKAAEFRSKAEHETGQQRAADTAEAQKYLTAANNERAKLAQTNAQGHALQKDYQSDLKRPQN